MVGAGVDVGRALRGSEGPEGSDDVDSWRRRERGWGRARRWRVPAGLGWRARAYGGVWRGGVGVRIGRGSRAAAAAAGDGRRREVRVAGGFRV
jgi:hypothetical protein